MHSLFRAVAVVMTASLFGVPALGQPPASSRAAVMPGRAETHAAAPDAGGPADQAMMAGMHKMSQDMSDAPMIGDPDHDFVAMMIPHHQGAIDMARVELRYGKDPLLRRLSQTIVAAQAREIAAMRRWQITHDHAR